jgi:hypothetical protein
MEHRFQHYQSTLMMRETAFSRPATFDIETCEPALMHQQLSAHCEKTRCSSQSFLHRTALDLP